MPLQPGEYNEKKWRDPPQFEVVDQTFRIAPGSQLTLVDQQFGDGPHVAATVVAVVPHDDREREELVVDSGLGRLVLTRRYGWIGAVPGQSVELRAGRCEITATDAGSGATRRIQIVVPGRTPRA